MRIGIDIREFKKDVHTGLRKILTDFLMYMPGKEEHELVFFGNQYSEFESLPVKGEEVLLEERNTFLWDQVTLPAALKEKHVDVFFSPYIKTPLRRICPYVNTVCDIIPITISKYKGIKAILEKIHFWLYSFVCSRRAAAVITLSHDAEDKIAKTFNIKKDKIHVVYPAVTLPAGKDGSIDAYDSVVSEYDLNAPYILYVGNFKNHKNLNKLIEAFDLLSEDVKEHYRLMLVGGAPEEVSALNRYIEEKDLKGKVLPVANVDHGTVDVFFDKASFFVFPSLAEGFGIPPVEAMARGIPVAASAIEPMKEVLGDGALFFDPNSAAEIANSITTLHNDQKIRGDLSGRGKERALLFNASGMSGEMLEVLRNAGKKKDLCISSEFPPVKGGISTQAYNLWSRLPGEETVILTGSAEKQGKYSFDDTDINIVRKKYSLGSTLFSRMIRTLSVMRYTWQQNIILNVKINHCGQVLSSGLAGYMARKIKGTPYILYVYSADILEFSKNPAFAWILKKIFRDSLGIVANSYFTKAVLERHCSNCGDKTIVIIPGIDINIFHEEGSTSLKDKYGIPGDTKVLLTVSRLAKRKGHENVLRAFKEIVEEFPDVVYIIAGDGPMRKEIEGLAISLNVGDKVIFAGEVEEKELIHFYNACDIFVLTPRYIKDDGDVEGFGIVFLEAGACGKPVVAGKSGGIAEAVIDGKTGILVDPEDVNSIKEGIMGLLKDEEYAESLGRQGLSRAVSDFNWQSRADALADFIRKILREE